MSHSRPFRVGRVTCRFLAKTSLLFLALELAICVTALPTKNITLAVSDDATTHGGSNVLCIQTHWTDIAVFLAGNFGAHAATVKSFPGEKGLFTFYSVVLALFFPASGLGRGLSAIIRGFRRPAGTSLEKAARAGALCMVVRSEHWKPELGSIVRNVELSRRAKEAKQSVVDAAKGLPLATSQSCIDIEMDISHNCQSHKAPMALKIYIPLWCREASRYWHYPETATFYVREDRQIHGLCHLPPGYKLAFVPRNTIIVGPTVSNLGPSRAITIPYSISIPKAVIAIAQSFLAGYTLYHVRGEQIELYGFAAFGFTVVPYLLMSIINFFGNALTPDYSALYLVGSDIMDEASSRASSSFEGVVGRLIIESDVGDKPDTVSGTFESINGAQVTFNHHSDTCEAPDSRQNALQPMDSLSLHGKALQVVDIAGANEGDHDMLSVPSCSRFKRTDKDDLSATDISTLFPYTANVLIGAIPVAIIGALTHFQTGSNSTWIQQYFTMSWIGGGVLMGAYVATKSSPLDIYNGSAWKVAGRVLLVVIYASWSIGGFWVVVQMLHEYGTCIKLD